MKNRVFIVGFFLIVSFVSLSQTFQVGSSSESYYDSSRSRSVTVELYYPSTSGGSNSAIATGTFPILVMGHGFLMGVGSYDNFVNEFVPQGYILALPSTESSASPDHMAFGADMAFLVDKITSENTNPSSVVFGGVGTSSAVMGHSMGGGSSVLAASLNSNITTMVNFAAAETTPSAISAASLVTIPSLIISGEEDCVSPDSANQLAIYNALSSSCKYHVQVKGGAHCYFADYNFNCTLGESFCLPVPPLSRADQHDVTFDFTLRWLDYQLKGDVVASNEFTDSITNSSRVNAIDGCAFTTSISSKTKEVNVGIYPNPSNGLIQFDTDYSFESINLYDFTGKITASFSFSKSLDLSSLTPGYYIIEFVSKEQNSLSRIMIR